MSDEIVQGEQERSLTESHAFAFADMPKRASKNGSESRDVLRGQLPTGEWVGVHQSMQPAGTEPNPPHAIAHTELICVREGTIEYIYNGKAERASAGDVLLVVPGTMHTLRNVGSGPASYFVIAVGGDVRPEGAK